MLFNAFTRRRGQSGLTEIAVGIGLRRRADRKNEAAGQGQLIFCLYVL
jgi:hypothetical protein